MPREIDRKLSLTAAAIGAFSRKDLASAFHAVNPATGFDIGRAHKWLQGRAVPRSGDIYADWVAVLGLDRTADWLAECSADELLQLLCRRPDLDGDTLVRRAQAFVRSAPAIVASEEPAPAARPAASGLPDLGGVYACYSHAWSRYFQGRLIRGELLVTAEPGCVRPLAQYGEVLPTGRCVLDGELRIGDRHVQLEVGGDQGMRLQFSLYRPSPPASLLAGLMMGAPLLSPDPEPTVTRIVMIRLPGPSVRLRTAEAYLPEGVPLAADLAALGLEVSDPAATESLLGDLLGRRPGQGALDRMPVGPYRELLARLDPRWLGGIAPPPAPRPLRVVRGAGRSADGEG